jgi:hypothetical protein
MQATNPLVLALIAFTNFLCGSPPPKPPAATPAKVAKTATNVVEGTSCAGNGSQISKQGDPDFTFDAAKKTVTANVRWGCGCPTAPVHTLVYSKTDPLTVRVCQDQSRDSCEALCGRATFGVSAALTAAGASTVVFVDP